MEEAAVHRALNSGITVVVAAGNENDDACKYSPAFVRAAITVGATSSGDVRASYSNFGSCVQIFAPGTNIRSSGHQSDNQIAEHSGTSMACPHVTGAAALFLGEDVSLTPAQVTEKIMGASIPNIIRGLSRQCPNKLLSISDLRREQPTAPPSIGNSRILRACPSFAKYRYADSEGDCHCNDYALCWSRGSKGCEFSRTRQGYLSATYFSADCNGCTCRSKAEVNSPMLMCNQYAVSRTPDGEGDCKCPSGSLCSTDGRQMNCPFSRGFGGRTGQYFLHTCSASTCKCYRTRSWPFF